MPKCIEIVHHKGIAGQPTCRCRNDASAWSDYCAVHDPVRVTSREIQSREKYRRASALENAVRLRNEALEECALAVRAWGNRDPNAHDAGLVPLAALQNALASLCRAESMIGQARLAVNAHGDRLPLHLQALMTKPVLYRP